VVTVEEVGYLVTYQVNGKSKLKPLKFDQILSHNPQNSRNWRWLLYILAFLLFSLLFSVFITQQ